jgi:hypothetical protein
MAQRAARGTRTLSAKRLIAFVANYEDLSTDRGYQFKFHCDHCGNGYLSRFQASFVGTAGSFLRAAGDIFGGVLASVGSSAYEVQRAVGGKAHDDALAAAMEEGRAHFHQCTHCGEWVCPQACWNEQAGMCESCAPNFEEAMAAHQAQAKAEAAYEQLREKARATDYAANVDMGAGAQLRARSVVPIGTTRAAAGARCPGCGAAVAGRFCAQCGKPAASAPSVCAGCGSELAPGAHFCADCGRRR